MGRDFNFLFGIHDFKTGAEMIDLTKFNEKYKFAANLIEKIKKEPVF